MQRKKEREAIREEESEDKKRQKRQKQLKAYLDLCLRGDLERFRGE